MSDINVEELEPRNLQTKDLFKIATILSKCGDKLMEAMKASNIDLGELGKKAKEMKEAGEGKKAKDVKEGEKTEEAEVDKDVQIFGIQIFSVILSVAESEIKSFMADLVNMKVEEFDVLPYQATLVIIEKLSKKENLLDFFQRATKLVEVFKSSEKKQTS